MSKDDKKILDILVGIIIKNGDYTSKGVTKAFDEFCSEIKVLEFTPVSRNNTGFVKTTIAEAVELAKRPIVIPYKINKYGNKECTVIPGALLKELGPDDTIVYGVQDGPNIAKLSITQLLACQANGFKYDKNNVVGSALNASSPLGV